jgi:hypothetical protein
MAQKWNLQDIRPAGPKPQPPRSVGTRQRPQQDIAPRTPDVAPQTPEFDPDLSTIDIVDGNSAKRKRVIVSAVIAALVVGAGVFVNMLLGGATVTVYPKIKDVSVQADVIASITPQVGELGYELLTLEATGEKQVKAAGKEEVKERAGGKLFVYNTSDTVQRLIKNTRFETGEGLVFRITESIEVPPAKAGVPGSVAADVFADGTGEQYNIPPQRFTVPGLKGSPQYDRMYAESNAAFTGGFDGEKYILDEAELATAQQALHIELRNTLLARLQNERPAGFVLYDEAVTISFESLPPTEYGDSLATIKERARLQVPLFKEDAFATYIAEQGVSDYAGEPVMVPDPATLTFTYHSATTTISDISDRTTLDFMLKGTARIVWQFDELQLKNQLVGIRKNDAAAVFASYPSIRSAQAEIRPFWAGSFPDDSTDIGVSEVLTTTP